MASSPPVTCGPCAGGLCGGKGMETLRDGLWTNNPISIQILGICSALAVTNRFESSLVMGAALIFVGVGSNLFVSLLRTVTPRRIRMIVEVVIIATFVILFDLFLKAFYAPMSKQLGPYVGLIITNCIIMGRAEAFAMQNKPIVSMIDGAANGLGYGIVLAIIGYVRELLGKGNVPMLGGASGALGSVLSVAGPVGLAGVLAAALVGLALLAKRLRLLGPYVVVALALVGIAAFAWWRWRQGETPMGKPVVLGKWYTRNQLMILAPGAFFALGFLVAAFNAAGGQNLDDQEDES